MILWYHKILALIQSRYRMFHHHKNFSCCTPTSMQPLPLSLTSGNHYLFSIILAIEELNINRIIQNIPSGTGFFTQHKSLEIHAGFCVYQLFNPFYCWWVFYGVYVLPFAQPFIGWKTSRLFLVLNNYQQSCYKHSRLGFWVSMVFIWIGKPPGVQWWGSTVVVYLLFELFALFCFLRNYQCIFQSVCIISHSCHQCMNVRFVLILISIWHCHYFYFICIFLTVLNVERLSTCLFAIRLPASVKWIFMSLWIVCFSTVELWIFFMYSRN